MACLIFLSWVAPTKFLKDELVIFFTVPPRGFGCRFRLGTALISDARRASVEVNGEKLAELNDSWSLVFTKAGWFKGAASVSSKARGKSCGLKMFLSQGKAFSRYLACCSSLLCIAKLFANLVDGDDSPALGWTELHFIFFGVEYFQGLHESFIQGLHFVTLVRWEANDVNMILSS